MQEYWSGLPFPIPGDLPNPRTRLSSPALQVDSLPAEAPVKLNSKGKVKVKSISLVQLFATPWTVAHQTPPSTESSRQEYWSGLPFPSPGDLPNLAIEARSPVLQVDALPS